MLFLRWLGYHWHKTWTWITKFNPTKRHRCFSNINKFNSIVKLIKIINRTFYSCSPINFFFFSLIYNFLSIFHYYITNILTTSLELRLLYFRNFILVINIRYNLVSEFISNKCRRGKLFIIYLFVYFSSLFGTFHFEMDYLLFYDFYFVYFRRVSF